MANASPESLITLFVVSITVMAFFTTSASNRLDNVRSPNLQVIGAWALFGSYILVFYLALFIMISDVFEPYPALFSSMRTIYAAFIIPGFVLLWDLFSLWEEAKQDPEFTYYRTIPGIVLVSILYYGVMEITPAY